MTEKNLERIADAMELQNALLLQLLQDQHRTAQLEHPDNEFRSDRSTETEISDSYGDLYGGSIAGWPFRPVSEQVSEMGGRDE